MKKQHTFNDSPLALQTEWKKTNESIGFYTNMPQETMGTKIQHDSVILPNVKSDFIPSPLDKTISLTYMFCL